MPRNSSVTLLLLSLALLGALAPCTSQPLTPDELNPVQVVLPVPAGQNQVPVEKQPQPQEQKCGWWKFWCRWGHHDRKNAVAKKGPAQLDDKELPAQQQPAQQQPAQQLPAQQVPPQRLPAQQLPAQRLPAQQVPAKRLPAQQVLPVRPVAAKQQPAVTALPAGAHQQGVVNPQLPLPQGQAAGEAGADPHAHLHDAHPHEHEHAQGHAHQAGAVAAGTAALDPHAHHNAHQGHQGHGHNAGAQDIQDPHHHHHHGHHEDQETVGGPKFAAALLPVAAPLATMPLAPDTAAAAPEPAPFVLHVNEDVAPPHPRSSTPKMNSGLTPPSGVLLLSPPGLSSNLTACQSCPTFPALALYGVCNSTCTSGCCSSAWNVRSTVQGATTLSGSCQVGVGCAPKGAARVRLTSALLVVVSGVMGALVAGV